MTYIEYLSEGFVLFFLFKYIQFLYLIIQAILYAAHISSLDDHEQLQLLLVVCFRTFF